MASAALSRSILTGLFAVIPFRSKEVFSPVVAEGDSKSLPVSPGFTVLRKCAFPVPIPKLTYSIFSSRGASMCKTLSQTPL